MEKLTKIKEISLRVLNNAEYTQFLSNTEQLLQMAGAGHLRIDAGLLTEFRDNIQKLTDISFQSRASTETEELAKLDKQRDDLAVYRLRLSEWRENRPSSPEGKPLRSSTPLPKITSVCSLCRTDKKRRCWKAW